MSRQIICPLCGTRVQIAEAVPGAHRLPPHWPGIEGNLCQVVDVTLTLSPSTCAKCHGICVKHPSGLCRQCFNGEEAG